MSAKTAGTYVRVLYDYEYKDADKNKIVIREGERFLLLKKANDEWWNVFRKGEKKPFYVPANYVEELPKTDTPVQKKKEMDIENSLDQYVSGDEDDIFQNGDDEAEGKSKIKKLDAYAEPEYANLTEIQSTIHKPQPQEELTYTNIEELKAHLKTKPPTPGDDERPIKEMENGWQVYKDPKSERQYYYHPDTKESTWKPPRGMKVKDRSKSAQTEEGDHRHRLKVTVNSFGTRVVLASNHDEETICGGVASSHSNKLDPKRHSMPVSPSLPPGWTEERTNQGETFYVNDVSSEKWLQSVDDTGRTYFYKEDGAESAWVLPESPNQLREEAEDGDENEENAPPKPIPVRLPAIPDVLESDPDVAGLPRGGTTSPTTHAPTIKEMKGVLNKTRVMENGKKVKKNWGPSFVVTTGPNLFFYKDQKAAQPKSGTARPDVTLDLQGALVEYGSKEVKSSKKNVIQITASNGSQILLQSDDGLKVHEWYLALSANVAHLSEASGKGRGSQGSLGSLDESSESVGSLHDRSTEEEPSSPPSTLFGRKKGSKKGGTLDRNAALDDPTLSQLEKSNRIKDRLINFFVKRPDLGILQEKGIYKDAVFGAHLAQLCMKEKMSVPHFVTQCMSTIERRGLDMDGIYRVSGNLAQIQKVRFMVDSNDKYDLDKVEWDVHVLCGSLKLFFRELKEPLIPFHSFNKFLDAIKKPDRSAKLRGFKDAVKTLPKPNRETMKELFKHLTKVIDKSKENRMQTQNIAIVFGPTLMWPEVETYNVAVTMVYQNQIVEFFLLEMKSLL